MFITHCIERIFMDNTKIGNKEAIALLVTITFNHIILNVSKTILSTTNSASLLNLLYVGILAIIFTCLVCYFLSKFPTFDIIDISNYLGGKVLKWIIGLMFVGYFVFFTGVLLSMFSSCLQIIYFQYTKTIYITAFLLISALAACSLKYNAIYRATFIIFPFIIISTLFLLFSNLSYFSTDKMYPIFGYGLWSVFGSGITNIFAFQALAYIYFMPPMLKEPTQIKKIAVTSIVLSCIFLLISVAIILFMFSGFVDTDELMPFYSAVKYIEYGSFFKKLDSMFVLIWILSFVSFISIVLKFSSNIFKKLTNATNGAVFTLLLTIALFISAIWQKSYTVSISLSNWPYKYSFLIVIIGIPFFILLFATIKQKIRKWFK